MKVCLLTTSFPRFEGDYAGVFVFDLATWLRKQGIEVEVVAPYEVGIPKSEVMNGIKVSRFRYMIPRRWQRIAYLGGIPANLRRYWLARAQLPLFFLAFFFRALRACRGCDVIHAYWIFGGLVAALLSAVTAKPAVLTVQGSDINVLYENRWLRRFRAFVVRRVAKIIAVSNPLAERVRELGAEADKVAMIPNGADTSIFADCSSDNPFQSRLVWVGRLSREKGVRYLIEAMAKVVKEFPQAQLTLVGDGPLRGDVERRISELALTENVQLTGMVSHEDIPGYLSRSDLLVLPSLSEGLPLVLVEAMSAGKPVVATRVGGIPDVLCENGGEQTGTLVDPGDSQALAQAISTMLNDPEKARLMGRNGRRRVERVYAWPTIAQQTAELYESLL
jgi:glycosyltransferase involved in cell wall biosynthesis